MEYYTEENSRHRRAYLQRQGLTNTYRDEICGSKSNIPGKGPGNPAMKWIKKAIGFNLSQDYEENQQCLSDQYREAFNFMGGEKEVDPKFSGTPSEGTLGITLQLQCKKDTLVASKASMFKTGCGLIKTSEIQDPDGAQRELVVAQSNTSFTKLNLFEEATRCQDPEGFFMQDYDQEITRGIFHTIQKQGFDNIKNLASPLNVTLTQEDVSEILISTASNLTSSQIKCYKCDDDLGVHSFFIGFFTAISAVACTSILLGYFDNVFYRLTAGKCHCLCGISKFSPRLIIPALFGIFKRVSDEDENLLQKRAEVASIAASQNPHERQRIKKNVIREARVLIKRNDKEMRAELDAVKAHYDSYCIFEEDGSSVSSDMEEDIVFASSRSLHSSSLHIDT